MNINWYSFYHKIRTLSIIALTLCSLSLIFDISLGEHSMFDIGPYDAVPYVVIAFVATAFSWLMMVKYKDLRDVPDATTKKEEVIYGIIGISLILLFALLMITLPLIVK